MKFIKNTCCLFFINIFIVSSVHANSADTIESHIVTFKSEVKVNGLLQTCLGLQITERHIATSKECFKAISKTTSISALKDQTKSLKIDNKIERIEFLSTSQLGSQMLLPILGGEFMDTDVYFETHQGESSDYGSVYYFDEAGYIINATLPLIRESALNDYIIVSENELPLGSPVFNEAEKLICFVLTNNLCQVPDFNFIRNKLSNSTIRKRSSDASCEVKFHQCSNAKFTTCLRNGYGRATCINERTGEVCSIATYPNGFNTTSFEQDLYCNNTDGCEVVICPTSCINHAESCRCRSIYKLNNQTYEFPENCLDYTTTKDSNSNEDKSNIDSTLGTLGGALALTASIMIPVMLIACILHYRTKQQQDFNRMAHEL